MLWLAYCAGSVTIAAAGDPLVLQHELVHRPGAAWMRLRFAAAELTPSSHLRITSLHDGARQRLDARSLAEWRWTSAYFNGDSVLVELISLDSSGTARFEVGAVELGPLSIAWPEDQCGETDDREPSADPAVARGMPIPCTAFLIDDECGCLLSAGHCVASDDLFVEVLQFNVPPSLPTGQVQHPHPDHQYAVDLASLQGDDSAAGDWLYLGVFPNANTGSTPRDAQSAALALAPPPAYTAEQTLRVTGHGLDADDPQLSQTLQTGAGPRVEPAARPVAYPFLQYQVDTQPGSSGSPVVLEATGEVVGIHTDAGCVDADGNYGTASDHPDLSVALAAPLGVCTKQPSPWLWLGKGLAGSGAVPPTLSGLGTALPGAPTELALTNAPPLSVAFLVTGGSQVDLPALGGTLVPSPDAITANLPIDAFGHHTLAFPWPSGPPSGVTFYLQSWVVDPGAPELFAASNGLAVQVP